MSTFNHFKQKYPLQTMKIYGEQFPYRYYKNVNSSKTIVLLTGGLGLSDLLLLHFEEFAKSYSVVSFDYPMAYSTNQKLVDAIATLLRSLEVKAFLVGQSLGGFLAQLLAQQHPDVVEGLILSNTGTLSTDMDALGSQCLLDMIKRIDKSLFMIKLLPFSLIKKKIKKGVMEKVKHQLNDQEQAVMLEICDEMEHTLTKNYELHMSSLLKDLQNHWNMGKNDFEQYRDKVLLILSDDDLTFNDNVKHALISMMPNPKVITDIRGGHLALLLKIDRYIQEIKGFIDRL